MCLPVVKVLWQTGAMVLAWVCNMLCKDTPVLIARNRTIFNDSQNEGPKATFERDMRWQKIFNLKQGAKSLAVAVTMPIVAVPIQDVHLLDYAVAHETVNTTYVLTASTDDPDSYRDYEGLMDKDPYTSEQQREQDEYELDDDNWHEDGKTLMLVPKALNNPQLGGLSHTGGKAIIEHNLEEAAKNINNMLVFPSPKF